MERTRKCYGRTDGRTDGQTDGRTDRLITIGRPAVGGALIKLRMEMGNMSKRQPPNQRAEQHFFVKMFKLLEKYISVESMRIIVMII